MLAPRRYLNYPFVGGSVPKTQSHKLDVMPKPVVCSLKWWFKWYLCSSQVIRYQMSSPLHKYYAHQCNLEQHKQISDGESPSPSDFGLYYRREPHDAGSNVSDRTSHNRVDLPQRQLAWQPLKSRSSECSKTVQDHQRRLSRHDQPSEL